MLRLPRTWAGLVALLAALLALAPVGSVSGAGTPGHVTYRLMGGDVYRLAAVSGVQPEDVSAELDTLTGSHELDDWLNTSPDGKFLLISTQRFGCAPIGGCLAVVAGDLSGAEAITADGAPVTGAFGAIASGGELVVYPAAGGPHKVDLWAISRSGDGWSAPQVITLASKAQYNEQPAVSADGKKVLFDCGSADYAAPPTQICEVSTNGGPVTVAVRGGKKNALHHADFAPGGAVVYEGDYSGEQIWKLPAHARKPVRVQNVPNDNSPCVLPDGRIVSLWLDRPGNRRSVHELKVMGPTGKNARMLLTGRDVLDVGIGCGG
jgi:hypothetical protein